MNYREMVTPAYLTSKSTVYILAETGNVDAKRIIDELHLVNQSYQKDKIDAELSLSESELNALMSGIALIVESRYESLSGILKTKEYTNLLDIACGHTPRALFCDREGIDYVGLDVPVVAEVLQQSAEKIGIGKNHPVFVGGDATNSASLKEAADYLKGSMLITCEGLLGYLSENEIEQVLYGIREILLSHGGTWISSDFGVKYEKIATANMKSVDAISEYLEKKKQFLQESDVYNPGMVNWEEEQKLKYLEAHGFKVEKIPFYAEEDYLASLQNIPDEWKAAYKELLGSSTLWKMTADSEFEMPKAITGAKTVDNLVVFYMIEDTTLTCKLKGRVDTISAPAFLEVLQENFEGITRLEINAKELEYISSAGLRVLLFAIKRLGGDAISMINTSDPIKDILETTGFIDEIDVK